MLRLAIDFGTSVTKIYKIGSGIVLAEPTCVTVQKETGEIRAFGSEAKRLLGKTAELTDVCFPVYEGEIVDERCASALLEYFLRKVVRRAFSVEALFCVPCACSVASREKYCRVARAAGLSRVSFAETPYLAVLGQDVPLSESNPVFAVDMGAGKTSCAAFSLDGVIAGLTMNVGGNNMDVHIIDHVAETSVSSADIAFPVRIYVDKVIEYAELVLKKLPAEVSAVMCKNGIYLAGGVTQIAGFADYVSERLQMEAHVGGDAQMAIVLGGGRAIGNGALLRRIELR